MGSIAGSLPAETEIKFKKLCRARDVTISAVIRMLIERQIEEWELQDLKEHEKAGQVQRV